MSASANNSASPNAQSLLFRSEFFNIVNRPNFGNPGVNVDTPNTFGKISSAGDGEAVGWNEQGDHSGDAILWIWRTNSSMV